MFKKHIFKIIFLSFISICSVNSQNYLQRFDGIPVINNGVTCISPFNGGIDQPRFQFIDIDGDGKVDLFLYDRDTSLNFYKNIGTASNPVFRLDSLKYMHIPIKNWYYFIDINHRGIIDLFTGGNSQTISFYKNTGTIQMPQYTLFTDPLKSNTDSVIFSEAVCIPTFADINADSTYDFFTGNSVGTVSYYKNIGTRTNFNFQFVTSQFGGIQIIGGADSPQQKNIGKSDNDPRHGASAITFADITNTGKLDLYWGDFFGHSIYRIKNTGTPQLFQWTTIDTFSPPPTPWISAGFNMPEAIDMDGDGKKDFFVGVIIGSLTKDNFVYYKNIGPTGNPLFSLVTKNFIPCIDVGSNSYPAFADVTGDGAPDLFIGSSDSKIAYYINTGTSFNPAFNLVTDSLPILQTSFNYAPTFADLDGDGKKDMLLGSFDGKLRYFKNTGTTQIPSFTFIASQFDAISVAQSSAPLLVDITGDGFPDLLIGDSGGHLAYYKNDGLSPPNFHFTLVNAQIPGIAVGNDSAPSSADIDGDGDKDLLIGNRLGKVFYYRNDGSATNPNFVLASNNYAGISLTLYAVPALVDINNDGDYDLFMGSIKGGLFYYENRDIIGINNISSEIPESFNLYQNYPNPFNPETKIKFDISSVDQRHAFDVQLKIYDALGREAATIVDQQLQPGNYETSWDASKHASGVYYYRLKVSEGGTLIGDYMETKKMVLIK